MKWFLKGDRIEWTFAVVIALAVALLSWLTPPVHACEQGQCWQRGCRDSIECGPGCYCAQTDWVEPPISEGVCVVKP